MRSSLFTATAVSALILCQTGAMAQTKAPTNQPAIKLPTNETQSAMPNTSTHGSLRAQVRDMLQKDDFTDIRVVPSSFMVRAKDKDGTQVVVSISRIRSLKYRRSVHLLPTIPQPRWDPLATRLAHNSFQLPTVTN